MEWILENAKNLSRRLLIIRGKDKLEKEFVIDISDTTHYKDNEWVRDAMALENSMGFHKYLKVVLFKEGPYGEGTDAEGASVQHELVHMVQRIIQDLVKFKNKYVDKFQEQYRGKPGIPGRYKRERYKMYGNPDKMFEDFEGEEKRHQLSDIEYFPILSEQITRLKELHPNPTNKDVADFVSNSIFFKFLRENQPNKYEKALRELYRGANEAI